MLAHLPIVAATEAVACGDGDVSRDGNTSRKAQHCSVRPMCFGNASHANSIIPEHDPLLAIRRYMHSGLIGGTLIEVS